MGEGKGRGDSERVIWVMVLGAEKVGWWMKEETTGGREKGKQ